MTHIHLRRMWKHCGCCHHFFKHQATLFTPKLSFMKEALSLHTGMYTSRQFHMACLDRNSFNNFSINNDSSISYYLQKNNLSTCPVHMKNEAARDIVTTAIEDVDLEELTKQMLNEKKNTQESVNFMGKVKELVSKKCDEMLANLGPEDTKKLQVIKLEHSFLLSEGYAIPGPEEMLSEYWLEALKLASKSQRLKYYRFLSKRNFTKAAAKRKKVAAKTEPEQDEEKSVPYEHGRLFMRIYESTMKRWLNYRLAASMMYGIPLVIDMDYVSHMRTQEIRNTASQLHDVYTLNRADTELPFHLHFTSCQQNSPLYRFFQLRLQEDQTALATVTEKSYLDLFDKQSLVYLSPDGRQVMKEFDPNAVYIIGAFNDKATAQPISYARANEQKIKCQRLPLDEYTKWHIGSKNLTLDQIIKIMLSVKNKKPWKEAFQAIPKRKLL